MGLGGGILGAVIGGWVGGPLGALIGAGIGAVLTGNGKKDSSRRERMEEQERQAQLSGKIKLFECLGKFAKADGRVSETEAAFISAILKEVEDEPANRKVLKLAFDRAKDSKKQFFTLASELARFFPDREVKKSILDLFCSLSIVDKVLSKSELENLRLLELAFGIGGFVDSFFADYQGGNQSENSRSGQGRRRSSRQDAVPENEPSLAECYGTLGCTENSSGAELKKAWRGKVMKYHPDRIQGKGLSASAVENAKREMQKINFAYETICKARGTAS